MEITKIGSFSTKEVEELKQAGTILGAVVKALDTQEITEVDEATMQLIAAVQDVANRAYSKTYKGQ